ncbi:spherulation-specific family 4 protein [Streptomyces sp. NBC_00035]|uniref:spherulation-specific family 4 protein n=1 Tax=Streptomyces sp. NBC_00035 TaxID=2903614 RepID=UPI00324A6862
MTDPATVPGRGGLLVPLYVHPAVDPAAWRALIRAGPQLYGVVLNVADGPGATPDPAFVEAVAQLREADVRVLGYVDTDYGDRPVRAVIGDLRRYRRWYDTDGAFLDRAASGAGPLRHYRRLVRAARVCGSRTVVLNPGVHPAPGYAEFADLLVTFEGTWKTYRHTDFTVPAWTGSHPPDRFCHLVYGVPDGLCDVAARTARMRGAAVHCAVPGSGANPWSGLPPTLEREAS